MDLAPDDWRRNNPRFQGDNFQKNLDLVEAIESMGREKGVTAAQLALAWLLARAEHIVPIPGTRRIARLEENAEATGMALTAEELYRLDSIAPRGAVAGSRYPEAAMQYVGR